VVSGEHVDIKPGNAMPVGNMPIGTIVHNVEIKIGKGGQLARSAGTYVQIVGRDQDYVILRLSTSEQRLVHGELVYVFADPARWRDVSDHRDLAGRDRYVTAVRGGATMAAREGIGG